MTGALAFAFMIGTVTTVNPCGFALLPAYFARRLGTDATLALALKSGVLAALGIVAVFGLVGGAVSLGVRGLAAVFPWTGFGVGLALSALGLAVMAGWRVPLRLPLPKTIEAAVEGDFIYGVGFGIISLSCTLPIFLTVTAMTLTGSVFSSALNLLAYALGVGTVMTGLSVSAALAGNGLAERLKTVLPYVTRISGGFLFIAGLYVSYLWGTALFAPDQSSSALLAAGERISGNLRGWLDGTAGQAAALTVLALLGGVFIRTLWRRRTDSKKTPL